MPDSSIRTTCPRDCYDRCGLLVRVSDGVIQRLVSDKANPHTRGAMCAKCINACNGVWLDDTARV